MRNVCQLNKNRWVFIGNSLFYGVHNHKSWRHINVCNYILKVTCSCVRIFIDPITNHNHKIIDLILLQYIIWEVIIQLLFSSKIIITIISNSSIMTLLLWSKLYIVNSISILDDRGHNIIMGVHRAHAHFSRPVKIVKLSQKN